MRAHTHRKCTIWRMRNIARKLRTAQLRYRTISGHVIVVSAQQRVVLKMCTKS